MNPRKLFALWIRCVNSEINLVQYQDKIPFILKQFYKPLVFSGQSL